MNASKSLRLTAVMLSVSPWMAFPASAQWAEMGVLGGDVCRSRDVNDHGQAIGTCRNENGDFVAAYWRNGQVPVALQTLETDGECDAVSIGNDGTISGNCQQGQYGERFPVRWNVANPSAAPQKLGSASNHTKSVAIVANNVGVIVGSSLNNNGALRAVAWLAGERNPITLPELGPLPPLLPSSNGCRPTAVSDDLEPMIAGVCSLRAGGTVAVKWSPSTLAYRIDELVRLPQGSNCQAVAINGRGQVAGTCQTATGDYAAVRWNPDGRSLTYLRNVVFISSVVQQLQSVDMNELGTVIGHYSTDQGLSRSFIWSPTGNPGTEYGRDIGTLGGYRTHARSIADNGVVIGSAQDGVGATRAFRWTVAGIASLGTLPGGLTSSADAISDGGAYVVGTSQTISGVDHAVGFGLLPRAGKAAVRRAPR